MFVSVPAPRRPAATALEVLRGTGSLSVVAWLPPGGARLVGLGSTATLAGSVNSASLRREADSLLASIHVTTHGDLPAISPRLLGGFAFDPRARIEPAWENFGEGRLVLPRWSYGHEGENAWLSIAVAGPLTACEQGQALDELERLTAGLEGLADARSEPRRRPREEGSIAADVGGESREEFEGRVAAILEEVEAGRVAKIVAARAAELAVESSADPTAVLQALVGRFPGCTGFLLERNGEAFLGATPERLLSLTGTEVAAEALAGSGPPGEVEALIASAKDRLEHGLVSDEIIRRLQPLCDDVRSEEIRPLELPNIVHLQTPIRARASGGTSLLELVAALHPTPAVGGVPREAAVRWIDENEPVGRGWYTGPFGWLDASGDGEFVVALRSGLFSEGRALLYAGAGLVSGSDPESEWEETEAKMRALRDALSVTVASGGTVPA
jgi:isochorismate synthase